MTEPATEDTGTGPNILIVDDSLIMRTMLKRAASLSGVPIGRIFEASNGIEALVVLDRDPVHVVFTDLNMPVMPGFELLHEMNRRAEWRDIVRVVISTDGSDSRRSEAEDLRVSVYIEKPFRPEVMRDVLTSLAPAAQR
jgi:two-component system chemotaxis response regulator CheY